MTHITKRNRFARKHPMLTDQEIDNAVSEIERIEGKLDAIELRLEWPFIDHLTREQFRSILDNGVIRGEG